MHEHMLTNTCPPLRASRDDCCQRDRSFAFQRMGDSLCYGKHAWLFLAGRGMPGLDKHVKDAAAYTLALHGNLFGEIDLHRIWTPRIDDVERGSPYISLAAAAANGAADLAAALHQHLRSHIARNGAFAPDDGRDRDRLTGFQMLNEFPIQFLHVIVSSVLDVRVW